MASVGWVQSYTGSSDGIGRHSGLKTLSEPGVLGPGQFK